MTLPIYTSAFTATKAQWISASVTPGRIAIWEVNELAISAPKATDMMMAA